MRIPRSLQAFIPLGILAQALNGSLSTKQRIAYGGLFGLFVLAVIDGILNKFNVNIAISDIIKFIVLIAYACAMIYAAIAGGRSTFRMGKTAQGLSKVGYHTLGVLCIFCGIVLIILIPYALYYDYSQ